MNIVNDIWRPPSLIELTQIILHMELTHLGWEASISLLKLNKWKHLKGFCKNRSKLFSHYFYKKI